MGRGEAFGNVTDLAQLRSRMLRPYDDAHDIITQEVYRLSIGFRKQTLKAFCLQQAGAQRIGFKSPRKFTATNLQRPHTV